MLFYLAFSVFQDFYVPFRAVHANALPIAYQFGGIFYADYCGQAVFPGNHCAVGHQSTYFGDQTFDGYKQGAPTGIGKGRDQYIALFQKGLFHVQDDACPSKKGAQDLSACAGRMFVYSPRPKHTPRTLLVVVFFY